MNRVSVVIPTCNRVDSLKRLLATLDSSIYPLHEIVIVDSSAIPLNISDVTITKWSTRLFSSEASVCIQRNMGIQRAEGEWIFLCDDDIEVPADYVSTIMKHVGSHPEAGAVSGLVLQNNGPGGAWVYKYDVTSVRSLLFRFIFKLSIWGEISSSRNWFTASISRYYRKKGNHLTRAGWPVITNFAAPFFRTRYYGLGVALVKRQWLLSSPFDETLDPHGLGDNFGVAAGFPAEGIHVVTDATVFHHRHAENRLDKNESFFRRTVALYGFIRKNSERLRVHAGWFTWSVIGLLVSFLLTGQFARARQCGQVLLFAVGLKRSGETLPPR